MFMIIINYKWMLLKVSEIQNAKMYKCVKNIRIAIELYKTLLNNNYIAKIIN